MDGCSKCYWAAEAFGIVWWKGVLHRLADEPPTIAQHVDMEVWTLEAVQDAFRNEDLGRCPQYLG